MKYVGCDLHKHSITFCVVESSRRVVCRRTLPCDDVKGIAEFLGGLCPYEAVVEATANYEWFCELADKSAKRIVLAHPGKLRIIAESVKKSDKVDAQILAEFLALDMIPAAYRPNRRQREHRMLVRQRVRVRQRLSTIQCRIRHLLSRYNADRANLWNREGREYLKTVKVLSADRFVLDAQCAEQEFVERQLFDAERRLVEFAKSAPAKETTARELLDSIPGVGAVTVEVVLAELADWKRFGSQKKIVSYAGLAPGKRESAGKKKDLPITKQGSRLLRWSLVEAAWQLIRYSPKWKGVYESLKGRRGAKRAITAWLGGC